MVAGVTRKADAILAASRPSTVWSINGVRAASSMAGWAQAKRSPSRRSGNTASDDASRSVSLTMTPRSAAAAASTFVCRGAARRPLERLVEVGHLNDVIATELLLGLGVGPVLHVALAVVLPDRRGEVPRLERSAADHDPRILQGLRVGTVGAPVGRLPCLVGAGAEIRLAFVDQDRVFHRLPSVTRLVEVLRSCSRSL